MIGADTLARKLIQGTRGEALMSLSDFVGALGRRWYVVLVGLLVTAGLSFGATIVAPPQYTARGLILLLPSKQAVGRGGNPLLGLGGLDLPARVLVAHFASQSAQQDISERAPDAEVTVSVDDSTRGPVLAIEVIDSTPQGALDMMNYVADQVPLNLERIQREVGAPEASMVRSVGLTFAGVAEIEYRNLIRAVIASVVFGLALTAFLVFFIDGVLRRRRGRSQADHDLSVTDTGPESHAAGSVDEEGLVDGGSAGVDVPVTDAAVDSHAAGSGHSQPLGADAQPARPPVARTASTPRRAALETRPAVVRGRRAEGLVNDDRPASAPGGLTQ